MAEARRPYRSALRETQARATRRAIVEAAGTLFAELGWSRTTIDAVAARAGVSRRTVFTAVGGKAALLALALDWALVGDDEPGSGALASWNASGEELIACSIAPRSGVPETSWSSATRPQWAPSSRKAKTESHRWTKRPRRLT